MVLCMCVSATLLVVSSRPISVAAGEPTTSARSCGNLVVQRRPKLVVFDVKSSGASCRQARKLLTDQHRAQVPAGKGLGDPDKILLCEQSSASRLKCIREGVRITLEVAHAGAI